MAVLLIIGGGAAAYVAQRAPTRKPVATKILTITPSQQEISCIQDIEWSPDGTRIAALGYQPACPGTVDAPQAVAGVYDATTGRYLDGFTANPMLADLLRQLPTADITTGSGPSRVTAPMRLPLYGALLSGGGPGGSGARSITFDKVAWSPDGKQLAITCTVSVGQHTSQVINGVVFCDPTGHHARVLAHTTTFSSSGGAVGMTGNGQPPLLGYLLDAFMQPASTDLYSGEWNVKTGAYVPAPASAVSGYTGMVLRTPALGYRWGTKGALIPLAPLTNATAPTVAPSTPVGIADGGPSFMMWQPGLLNLRNHMQDGQHNVVFQPGIATLSASFVAWSPDGQYLVDISPGPWRIQPAASPVPSRTVLEAFGVGTFPTLPAHDATLSLLFKTMATDMTTSDLGVSLLAAWIPNGHLLAIAPAATPGGGQSTATSDQVSLYDCVTGQKLVTLTLRYVYASVDGYTSLLRWSPDGGHLLYYDSPTGAATIWGPDMLPRV